MGTVVSSASDVKLYRFGERNDGKTIVGEWVIFKDKKTLADKGFWSYSEVIRTSPGVGTNHRGKTVFFREEIPTEEELNEVFVVPDAPEPAAKVEHEWRDCPASRKYWEQLKSTQGMTREMAESLMKAQFPKQGGDAFGW